ncbi:carbohydrate ABC transporter permease [Caldilinea sp.]|jgi:multiple sugar transport system permease protein|uniref:carbohydrate ABC transporter permease n=2 Tax=Caldilinea sp. TaxID=2293560 RepID=UPI002603958E|nr:sugar ABC transporter permease [uncultured Caldilinea sp.]
MSRKTRDNLRAYLFVSPWLISLLVFTAYPMLASFYFSMTRYTIVRPPVWIGLENFRVMFTKDDLFWVAVWNTLYYTVVSVPLQMLVALFLATLLNLSTRGIGFYRTAFYLPALVPAVVTTLLWMLILDPRAGLANAALEAVGLPKLGWMYSVAWSKPSLIIIALWTGVGQPMLIFLAGLKNVPQSLLEAAIIDGTNAWQRYWRVIIPLLTPTIFFNLLITLIASFQVFTTAFVATASASGASPAGPLNSMLVYMVHLYRQGFSYFAMGYASAMAVVLFLVLVVLTLILVRSSREWVHYEGASPR